MTGYGHPLRLLRAALAAITYQQRIFPTCYGPEFASADFKEWLKRLGVEPINIFPGSPWENGYNERFNGTLRREVLNREWFASIRQAQIATNQWLRQYNHIRPHHALGTQTPVPETLIEVSQISGPNTAG